MRSADRILIEFGVPSETSADAEEIRRILVRLVDAGAISIGELQIARDIVQRSDGADESAYLAMAAMFMALHSGNASLDMADGGETCPAILANAGRIDRRTEELAGDADDFSSLVERLWPKAFRAVRSLRRFVVLSHDAIAGTTQLYFRRYYDATNRVREILSARLSPGRIVQLPQIAASLSYSRGDFSLSGEQKCAVEAAVANRLAVVTGGPGTGKTTIVCSILRALIRLEGLSAGDIALAAPTGRAAQRMGEALRKQCLAADDHDMTQQEREILNSLCGTTIHSLLGGRPPKWRHDADNPLPRRLVVIDEASMVDLLLMRSLLDALRDDCRLVLLGDANQLPPVEAGAVLGDLVGRVSNTIVELTHSRRFKGSLRVCAEELRRGKLKAIFSPSSRMTCDAAAIVNDPATIDSCFWHEPADAKKSIDAFLREWADANGLGKGGAVASLAAAISPSSETFSGVMTDEARALFDALDASRILTVVRNGPFGVVQANENLLRHRLGYLPRENRLVAPGIPVIVTENAPSLGLFNGDVGVTVKGAGGMFVVFPRGGKVVACPISRLPEHEIAYAITVHKSQGSEFGNVLVVLPDTPGHPLLTRRMVYTAITRARLRSVIFSTRQALQRCSAS